MRLYELEKNLMSHGGTFGDKEFEGTSKGKHKLPFDINGYEVFVDSNGQITIITVWDGEQNIGKLKLSKVNIFDVQGYEILYIAIKKSYQNKLLGLNLYTNLVELGINLYSKGSHSPGAEKLWKMLYNNHNVSIWAINQNKISKVSLLDDLTTETGSSIYDDPAISLFATKKNSMTDKKLGSISSQSEV